MNRSDLLMMALHNLWARKSRTAFNIFGIVISCAMLLLVFAGSRGARTGLSNLFAQSDFARHFAITPDSNRSLTSATNKEPPAKNLGAGISEDRMQRIHEMLNKDWERENLPVTRVNLEKLEELRGLPAVAAVLPNRAMPLRLTIDDLKVPARAVCFATNTSGLEDRVVAGHAPQPHSAQGKLWIDEYRAWRLGYRTDQQLQELIGKKVELRFEVAASKMSPGMKRFASVFGIKNIAEAEQFADTFAKLFADLDSTDLSDLEKESIRSAASRLGLNNGVPPKASSAANAFIFREFEIAGIVKSAERSTGNLFQMARVNSGSDLLIDWRDYHSIEKATHPNRNHFYTVGSVTSSEDLAEAIAGVEKAGLKTRSALDILEKADVELGKVRLVVVAIALVILLIASVGIMNTMIIAVMERTPEFGMMKAVGAKDADIRWLVLVEAGLTGILGAAVSLVVARILDSAISQFARRFLEQRIRQDFDFDIFVYSFTDVLIVVVIAITICLLASLLPSRRAAKLDPVVAMK